MSAFYDSNGIEISLGREIGRGGEGVVYSVSNRENLVAKIYHETVSDDKAEKLREMVALKSDKLLRLAAWVEDVLTNSPNGKVVGFLMPKLNFGTAIHELYNPKSRRQIFPEADWRFLIAAAANLARAFAVVHSHQHAVGDVNHGNVVVARDATVRLIDCDSYHITAANRNFLCEVGVSTHTPPELQNHSLREIVRTANHDAFGLAVLIFQLLFMGRHPFSGKFLGDGDNTLEDSIRERRFAFGDEAKARNMKQPPGTLPLAAVSAEIARLFERAFLEIENRPTARDWVVALDKLGENLRQCPINSSHHFLNDLTKCSWCNLEIETGVLFFPAHLIGEFMFDDEFDFVTLNRLINSIKPPGLPRHLPQTVSTAANTIQPSFIIRKELEDVKLRLGFFICLLIIGVFIFTLAAGATFISFLGALIFWGCTEIFKYLTKNVREQTLLAADGARQNFQKFQDDWHKSSQVNSFENARYKLKTAAQEYQNLESWRKTKLQKVEKIARQRQLEMYLRTFPLSSSSIEGLDKLRLQVLNTVGVRTANDITTQKFAVLPDFSYLYRRRLFEWRARLEKKFVFRPSSKVLAEETELVETEIANLRTNLQKRLREGLPQLQQTALQIGKKHLDSSAQFAALEAQVFQTESDSNRVSSLQNKAAIIAIAAAGLSFVIGIAVRQTNYSPPVGIRGSSELKIVERTIPADSNSNKNELKTVDSKSAQPENWGKAREFFQTGEKFYAEGKFTDAIKSYRQAIKANPNIAAIHDRLGEAYFHQSHYQEAVVSYTLALRLKDDFQIWHKLGTAQERLGNNYETIAAFRRAIAANPIATDSYFALGATLRRIGVEREAIEPLETVITLRPQMQEAHLELGLCYLKTGDKKLVWREYNSLTKMDSPLAEQLYSKFSIYGVDTFSDNSIIQ